MTGNDIEHNQAIIVEACLKSLKYTTWNRNPGDGSLIHPNDLNKFYANIFGYDCLITVEFQDPR